MTEHEILFVNMKKKFVTCSMFKTFKIAQCTARARAPGPSSSSSSSCVLVS